jgi:hypothetical protein
MSDYPRMLYQKGGGYTVAQSEEDEKALGDGWSRTPGPEAFQQFSPHHTQRVDVSDDQRRSAEPKPSKTEHSLEEIVEAVIKRLDDRGLLRRPPGRPPANSSNHEVNQHG